MRISTVMLRGATSIISVKMDVEHILNICKDKQISEQFALLRCSIDTILNCNVVHDIDDVDVNKERDDGDY